MASAIEQILATTDEKVKASATDNTPDFLDGKVDNSTIVVNGSDKLERAALTGGVTTIGNAATVVTNANLTGPVTSVGNATAIADKALALSKLADGTDGQVVTYDAAGVITAVGPGTSGQLLTSNGAGAAPSFETPAGGGGLSNVIFQWTGITDSSAGFGMVDSPIVNELGATDTGHNHYVRNQANGQNKTMFRTKFLKAEGVDNLLLYARMAGNGASDASANIIVGSVSGGTSTVSGNTPTWRNTTIDISTLSNGTVYDFEIKIQNSLNNQVWCYAVIVFGAA